ncbi:acyl-CoA dehydrogenase family protein [Quisquiliibacterium transsilvanicum]|uniref:Medium-chain specific acyl-CoA dehydrogenase, mitochondrial n=1 Tax=Quisquiliibacterium transsilvanicum TaxID=1549638 RepID=A0A7W8M8M8_9BURK|nr:acyl-CoA dehydrogenase family protein [Quisquiliibacterium transsilvanicum]MBB5271184.1 alkylation response protein AidB-like acyl-CoA dehydrogenase [Quisquiliibacterium transsilvanicum]
MMLSADETALLERAGEFARQVVAVQAPTWERQRRIGREALLEAARLGLTRLEVPAAWGGLGMSFSCKARLADILGAADFGFTMSLLNTHNVAAKLARDAPPEVARRYLPGLLEGSLIGCTALTEPGAGSDFAAIETRATRTADGWRIDGAKAWITNASDADVVLLYAQTEPGSGGRGIAGFVVDARRAGFVREPAFQLAGQHSIGTGGFRLEGYLAHGDEMLQPPGRAFKAALGSINGARTYIAAMSCGMTAEALRVASAYGEQRHTFGEPLAAHQGWRWRLAEASSELAACRLMVDRAATLIDAGEDAQLASAQAKLLSTRMAERQLHALSQAMGAEGLREAHPFGRHLIGARVASFVDGSTEMLLERISAVLRKGS